MSDELILLVDDEEDIRLVLGISLEDLGYKVLMAENGEEAFKVFKEKRPPIVISDIKMPDIDGIELLRMIKNESPETEVIMITGHGDMDSAIESFQHEAADFITKPINVDSLELSLLRAKEKIVARNKLREYTEKLENLIFEKTARLSEVEKPADSPEPVGEVGAIQEKVGFLFNEMPFYLTVHDRNLKLTAVNRRFKEDFGEALGRYCYTVCKQADEPCPDCPVEKTFSDGAPHQAETELTTSKGEKHSVTVWTSPMKNMTGEITHAVVMSTRTSQLLKVQDQLTSLGLLIGSVSHAIKGLLTGLDGGMYMLDSGLKKDNRDQMREGLDIVKLMVGRIKKMVMEILLFSKERDLQIERLSLNDFAVETAAVIKPKITGLGLKFKLLVPEPAGFFEADSGFLRTALVNILENALEACTMDKEEKQHLITYSAQIEGQKVIFKITDNGIGMDEEIRDNVFNLFYSKKDKKGTGLGLYITNKIVRQHGGDIEIESSPGLGSTITVTIPAKFRINQASD